MKNKINIQQDGNEIINDDYILSLFITPKQKLNRNYLRQTWLDKHENIKIYLETRYKDSLSIKETITRIKNHIEIRPICPICGKPTSFRGFNESNSKDHQIFSRYCSILCASQDTEYRQKMLLEHFGYINVFQRNDVKEKIKKTCLEKYGVEYSGQAEQKKEKTKETFIKHYGVDHVFKSEYFKEKSKQTCLDHFGVEYSWQSENNKLKAQETKIERYNDKNYNNREKSKKTCLKKYGVEYVSQDDIVKQKKLKTMNDRFGGNAPICDNKIKEKISISMSSSKVQEKMNDTKKKNKSFNVSKPENDLHQYILTYFPDVKYSYRSDLYPFNCDFYIPSLDLYIEFQGSWTHGKHPFNANDLNDIQILEKWKSKNTKYYENAIQTWTIRDVNKRNMAKQNKLKYKEFWSLQEAKQFINSLIK